MIREYGKYDDRSLARLAQEGDEAAFSCLAGKYKPLLLQFLQGYTNVRPDAEDLCQETLKRAYLHLHRYDSRYAFSTWLYNIARNAAIDLYRERNAGLTMSPDTPGEHLESPTESPEDTIIRRQTRQRIAAVIAAMPERYREPAEYRFLKEYAYEEIARQLQLPLNTVRTRIRRAREWLSEALLDEKE